MADEEKNPIKDLLQELQGMRAEKEELEWDIAQQFEKEYAEMAAIEKQVQASMARVDELTAQMRDADPQAFADLATAEREISKKEDELKALCYALPLQSLKKGQAFSGGGLRVTVSRATIRREYKPDILKAHPGLENMYIDGDPVIVRSVDAAVLDRLVAEGRFDKAEAKKFLLETKIRNPQVRIRTEAEEEEDDE